MMTKIFAQKLKRDLFRLSILSLVTIVIWLILVTYRTLTQSQVKPDVKKQLQPLTANLELDTMEQVKTRLEAPAIDWQSINQATPIDLVETTATPSSGAANYETDQTDTQ